LKCVESLSAVWRWLAHLNRNNSGGSATCFPDRLNPRSTSAGTPRADPRGSEARSGPAPTFPTNATRPRRSNHAANRLALPLQPIQALGEHQHIPFILLTLDVVGLSLSLGRNGTRRRAPPPRTASTAARAVQSIPDLRLSLRRITHVALNLPSPSSSCFDPRSINFDGTPASPEPCRRGFWSPASSAAARSPRPNPSHPIQSQRSRLDPEYPFKPSH
jgi:hypothetical protein